MKRVIRLTESDLVNIVKKVLKEGDYRAKFEDQEDWIDQKNNPLTIDPDLDSTGYYDFEYEPKVEVEDFEDIPDDIRKKLFTQDEHGERMYNKYKEKYGKFKYARKKDEDEFGY